MNATTGVPFTTPITQFPFNNNNIMFPIRERNLAQNTNVFANDLQFSPPSPFQEEEERTENDGFISWGIQQQNFIINYHVSTAIAFSLI